ncbi:MAG: hypothetical protein HeimC2_11520 [Candidatus Heimdallarchaeota archaeon LC_2]|nr:MAG: hypothetical protein HeimC2_11520 [Candidatus Heimdallarchaeota archaeon LC_2]
MPDFEYQKNLAATVLIGEKRYGNPVWGLPYDPYNKFSEGQFRILLMRLQKLLLDPEFKMNQPHTISNGDQVFIIDRPIIDGSMIFVVILQEVDFDDKLIKAITEVVNRRSIYTSKKFYSGLQSLYYQEKEKKEFTSILGASTDPLSALNLLKENTIESESLDQIANLLSIIGTNEELSANVIDTFYITLQMISKISDDQNADIMLDAAFVIASRFLENQDFIHSTELLEKIATKAKTVGRTALEIACRIRTARITKLKGTDNGLDIINILSPIDENNLEEVSQDDREEYYCLQGYGFYLMSNFDTAENLYMMAITTPKSAVYPSMNKAEAHWFIGRLASQNYSPEVATRELITAASIALANGNEAISTLYNHLAAKQELKWSFMLSSAAVISRLEKDLSTSEYQAWLSLSKLLAAYRHADKIHRIKDISNEKNEIISITSNILDQVNTDSSAILNEIVQNLNLIDQGELTIDNELELLKFLSSKISSMTPLPTPIILLIANDGRLIMGGDVLADSWEESISSKDHLFSGALSAIMAILSEVTSSESYLRMVDAGQTQIMIEKSIVCTGALLVDRDLIVIREGLRSIVEFMAINYPRLEEWDGYSIDFSAVRPKVNQVFNDALSAIKNY